MAGAAKTKSKAAQSDSEQTALEHASESDVVSTNDVEAPDDGQVSEQPVPKTGPPEGLYPKDAELFKYTFKCNGETVWLPMKFEWGGAVAVWEIHDQPMHIQTWTYMKWAKIPNAMQRKVVEVLDLAPDEYLDCFDTWLKAVGGTRLGE